MQEICSNKSGIIRASKSIRASKIIKAVVELAEKKTRLKYLEVKAEQNEKLVQIKA